MVLSVIQIKIKSASRTYKYLVKKQFQQQPPLGLSGFFGRDTHLPPARKEFMRKSLWNTSLVSAMFVLFLCAHPSVLWRPGDDGLRGPCCHFELARSLRSGSFISPQGARQSKVRAPRTFLAAAGPIFPPCWDLGSHISSQHSELC